MAHGVIVVDMLRGFLEEDHHINEMQGAFIDHKLYCGDKSRKIITPIFNLVDLAVERAERVYFVCDSHAPDDKEFNIFPPHCIAGTEEAQIITELESFVFEASKEYISNVYRKQRYSGFYGTRLEEDLRRDNIEEVTIVGVCTDICVLYTAADARNRDFNVIVREDCVASFNKKGHKNALKHMKNVLGVFVI